MSWMRSYDVTMEHDDDACSGNVPFAGKAEMRAYIQRETDSRSKMTIIFGSYHTYERMPKHLFWFLCTELNLASLGSISS